MGRTLKLSKEQREYQSPGEKNVASTSATTVTLFSTKSDFEQSHKTHEVVHEQAGSQWSAVMLANHCKLPPGEPCSGKSQTSCPKKLETNNLFQVQHLASWMTLPPFPLFWRMEIKALYVQFLIIFNHAYGSRCKWAMIAFTVCILFQLAKLAIINKTKIFLFYNFV